MFSIDVAPTPHLQLEVRQPTLSRLPRSHLASRVNQRVTVESSRHDQVFHLRNTSCRFRPSFLPLMSQSSSPIAQPQSVSCLASTLRQAVKMNGMTAQASDVGGDTKQVLVPVANGSEEMEAVILIDVLRRAGADVTVASVEAGTELVMSRGVRIVADCQIGECAGREFDLIVLPGGMPGSERLRDSTPLRDLTARHARSDRLYAAMCAAPAVALNSWGLLHGKKATAHPAFWGQLETATEARVCTDGNLCTSRGPRTAFEFALALVERLWGKEKADEVAGPMVVAQEGEGKQHEEYGDWEPSRKFTEASPPQILVPLATGTEEMEAVIVIDVLRRAGADVTVASVYNGELQIKASRHVKLVADVGLGEVVAAEFDLIVLPGGMPGALHLRACEQLCALVKGQVAAGRLMAAICAAPAVVLNELKLLEGKKATAHPAFSGQLADQTAVNARVVTDGNIVTSRGPGTAMEFALVLVEKLYGKEKAEQVAGPMVMRE